MAKFQLMDEGATYILDKGLTYSTGAYRVALFTNNITSLRDDSHLTLTELPFTKGYARKTFNGTPSDSGNFYPKGTHIIGTQWVGASGDGSAALWSSVPTLKFSLVGPITCISGLVILKPNATDTLVNGTVPITNGDAICAQLFDSPYAIELVGDILDLSIPAIIFQLWSNPAVY